MEEGLAAAPLWVVAVAAVICACLAFLATRAADALFRTAPVSPTAAKTTEHPPVLPVVAGAAIVGWSIVSREAEVTTLFALAAMIVALSACYWTDMTRGVIADVFTLPPIALICALGIAGHNFLPVISGVAVALPFALAALMTRGKGFGWGDVRLIALGATVLGFELALMVFALAGIIACTVAIVRGKRTERIAFSPYLVAGIGAGMMLPATPHLAG